MYILFYVDPVLRIRNRIRICMFLDLLVPDPLVIGTDQDHSIIKQKNKKNLLSYYFFVTFLWLFILKIYVNLPSKSYKQKNLGKKKFLLASWRSVTKIAGSWADSGFINQMHGSADPDPHQNVMDPQLWSIPFLQCIIVFLSNLENILQVGSSKFLLYHPTRMSSP
jgi:hypothetical protein